MLRVGIVGIGFMGMVHYLSWQKMPGVKVMAIAEHDAKKRAGDWRSIQGNFGPPGEQMDLAGVATYASAAELIADADVDLIDVTLPPALHESATIQALEAGKHVFVEKPLALDLAACDRMVAAAAKADRRLLVGHVLPYFPEYAWALGAIESGDYGKLRSMSLRRVISDPQWLANYWSAEQVGGPMLDLHVHDAHFLRLACGMPERVATSGSLRDGLPEHWHSLFGFGEDGPTAHIEGGVISQPSRSFLHGFEIQLDRATLAFEFAVTDHGDENPTAAYHRAPTLMPADGPALVVDLGDGDPMRAFEAELGKVATAITRGEPCEALECALARDAISICEMQTASLHSGF